MQSLPLNAVFEFDYKSMSLKPVEQLVCIRMFQFLHSGQSFSLNGLSDVCNCSRQTVYTSVSKLVDLGFFESKHSIGKKSVYSLGSLFQFDEQVIDEPLLVDEKNCSSQADNEPDFSSIKSCFYDLPHPDDFDDTDSKVIHDVPVDALLSMGENPMGYISNHCAPSNSKRASARRKRKKKK
ncbi:hypothetical protein [Pseudoalteromonas amylolytica]|uniref:Uncharacterized protein n=1 Tax=Pseudoalteromonas amylolytica TaxID=1859457 RepID=A0A1S1MXR2_9GAMM|nr:hypothetical protein [Pseudoalteromonas amylolytica]OHU91721.1 hypothetical protein BET10_07945 [Pseudoalteromonas amylolytica]